MSFNNTIFKLACKAIDSLNDSDTNSAQLLLGDILKHLQNESGEPVCTLDGCNEECVLDSEEMCQRDCDVASKNNYKTHGECEYYKWEVL